MTTLADAPAPAGTAAAVSAAARLRRVARERPGG